MKVELIFRRETIKLAKPAGFAGTRDVLSFTNYDDYKEVYIDSLRWCKKWSGVAMSDHGEGLLIRCNGTEDTMIQLLHGLKALKMKVI